MSSLPDGPVHVWHDGAFYKWPAPQKLADTAGILRSLASSVATPLRSIFTMDDGTVTNAVVLSPIRVLLVWHVTKLPITTFYTLSDEEAVVTDGSILMAPTFRPGNGGVNLAPVFDIPSEINVRFGTVVAFDDVRWSFDSSVLMCAPSGLPGNFLLPLPNVYTDGAVCMGNDYAGRNPTLIGIAQSAWSRFQGSLWNADLLDTKLDKARRMFRVQLSGTTPEPLAVPYDTESLRSNLVPVSNPLGVHLFSV